MDINKELVERLVKQATSFNQFVELLYGSSDGNSWRKAKAIVSKYGVDTSHYRIRKYTKESLEKVVAENDCVANVCRKLGLKPGGSSQSFIARKIKEFELPCSHFKKRSFKKMKNKSWREVLVKREEGNRRDPNILKRCLVESGRKYKCEGESCPVAEKWLGKDITLQVHHHDGDCLNDKPDNISFLCPNCHTQTPNWCNKGSK